MGEIVHAAKLILVHGLPTICQRFGFNCELVRTYFLTKFLLLSNYASKCEAAYVGMLTYVDVCVTQHADVCFTQQLL